MTKTYESKMTDLDAKIKALRKQKRKLQKDHEVKDLKLKLKKQSEQIAQLTADNSELKAKLSDADMSSVAFDPTPKLEKQKGKLEAQAKELEEQRTKIENQAQELKRLEQACGELTQQNEKLLGVQHSITPRYKAALQLLVELGDKYGFNGKGQVNRIKKIKSEEE